MAAKSKVSYMIQGFYEKRYGWEDLVSSEDREIALSDLKAYRENELQYRHRIISVEIVSEEGKSREEKCVYNV